MRSFLRITFCSSIAVAAGLGAAVACNVYSSSLLHENGSSDAGPGCHWGECWWSGTDPTTGCHTVGMPTAADRPKPTGGSNIPPIYLAVTHIWTGQSSPEDAGTSATAYQYFGLDLDGTCTNPIDCPAEKKQGVVSCQASSGIPADGVGCRDNTFAKLVPMASAISATQPFGVSQQAYNCSFYRGSFNIIVKISDYNGTANDDTVRLDAYMSPGLEDDLPTWDCLSDPTPQKDQVTWLPTQRWYVDQAGLSGPITTPGQLPPAKKIFDAAAYVRQGYLVVRMPDGAEIRFIGDNSKYPGFSLILYGGELVGHLHKNADSLWVLDDTLVVGRTKASDLLQSFRLMGVCPNTIGCSYYNVLSTYLRTSADITADGGASPNAPCDAISVGFALTLSSATPGDAVPVSAEVPCVPPPGVPNDAGPADGACP